jgi:hypothetical protein
MSDPAAPTTPRWTLKEFSITTPFKMEGELEYQSWADFERTLSGGLTLESLPQFRFEFGQKVSRIQGGLGLQLWQTELPRIGPVVAKLGVGAMVKWADDREFELKPGLEIGSVQWPSFRFTLEGSMSLSGHDGGGRPTLNGGITGGLMFKFDLFAPRGTFRRRRH